MFEYLVENGCNEKYELVWYVHNPDDFPEIRKIKNVRFVSYDWEESDDYEQYFAYFENLLTAKFLFTTDAYWWMRYCRADQVRGQLWHGYGYKSRKGKGGAIYRPFGAVCLETEGRQALRDVPIFAENVLRGKRTRTTKIQFLFE